MKNILRLLTLMRPFSGQAALSVLFAFAAIAAGIGLMGTSAWLISRAALQPSIAVLQVSIVGVRFFGISRGVFRYLERLVSHDVNLRLLSGLRRKVYDTLARIWPASALQFDSGDLLSRATADVDLLENFYIRVVSPVITAVLITAAAAVFIGTFDPRLAWLLTAGMLANGLLVPLLDHLAGRAPRETLPMLRGQLSTAVSQNIQGQRDLLAYGMQNARLTELSALQSGFTREKMRLARREGLSEAFNTLLPGLTALAVLALAVPLVSGGQMDGVLLAVVVLITLASFEAVAPLGMAAQNLALSAQAARRLFGLEAVQPAVLDLPDARPLPEGPISLSIRGLSFSYPTFEGSGGEKTDPCNSDLEIVVQHFVLRNISFELPPGKHIAIAGPSGAGKTTLFSLLLRLWDAPPGSIFLNGTDIRSFTAADVRGLFSVVSQNGWLFGRNLRQNLLIAKPGAGDGQLIHVLEQTGLGEWYAGLPDGLNTLFGEGTKISGGERQRLMIARALLQDNPIWLLDEPTVHLDAASVRRVLDVLSAVLKSRSAIWITHNLEDIPAVDEVLVLREV
jgi:ATP-binding cassette subfamily C protein CydC